VRTHWSVNQVEDPHQRLHFHPHTRRHHFLLARRQSRLPPDDLPSQGTTLLHLEETRAQGVPLAPALYPSAAALTPGASTARAGLSPHI